ncbi:hypothetical protein [Moorena bouillonii]|uniref:hypothetical protein n=1 Tax=Moorena bouillonii TaxID=207920 RepID=UPI00117DB7D0|nr:hypothetical protein [Moorena bouillonii]
MTLPTNGLITVDVGWAVKQTDSPTWRSHYLTLPTKGLITIDVGWAVNQNDSPSQSPWLSTAHQRIKTQNRELTRSRRL